jgi:DNA-damage-inducible protein D
MPENIPPVEHIKQVEKRLKSSPPKLKLEDKDAKGLAGEEKTE